MISRTIRHDVMSDAFLYSSLIIKVCSYKASFQTYVRGITISASARRVGKVMGSMFGPNRVIAKDVKSCTYYCYVRCATLIERAWANTLAPKRRKSLSGIVKRLPDKGPCNQRDGCLLYNVIYEGDLN